MARYVHAASVVALLAALSTSAQGQVQTNYTYDVHGRLTGVARPDTSTGYTYDKAGNRIRLLTTQANRIPVANADSLTVTAGQAFTIDPRINDTDADSDPLTVTGVSPTSTTKGSITYTATSVTYTANSGQSSGSDNFTYTVSDGKGGTATGTASVTISAFGQAPVAQNFAVSITPNSSGNVASYSLPLSFTGGAPTSVVISSAPGVGSASVSGTAIQYSSSAWTGQTTLQYTGTNGSGTSAAATATLSVKPVISDAPGLTANPGQTKIVSLSPYIVTTSGISSMSLPNGPNTQKGSASISGTTLTYTPNAGATGTDTFTYQATSPGGVSAAANITFTMQNCSGSVPVAGAASATVAYQSLSNVIPLNLSGGAPTSVNYVEGSSHGSVEPVGATMYYSPFPGYSGPDSFTYNATNACGTSNTATGTITVLPPTNHSPVAVSDSASIAANSYAYFDPRSNDSDPDGDPLTLVSVTAPQNGSTWTNTNNYISYVPTAGWSGTDYFYYTISDGRGGTATGAVNVFVAPPPVNHAPTANAGTTDPVWQSTTAYIDPRSNDTDPDGDTLTVQSLDNFYCAYGMINGVSTCPGNIGSVSKSGNTIVYSAPLLSNNGSPGSNYIAVVVWYTISDGRGGTSQSYQIINVYGPA